MKIHIRTAGNGNQGLVFRTFSGNIGFQTRQRQRAGRLGNAARVIENILDRAANRIGIDCNDFIQKFFAEAEGSVSDDFDRRTV